jgi:hypothetical protein
MRRISLVTVLAAGALGLLPSSAFAVGGDFVQPVTSPETAGDAPRAIVSADFDGDDEADLAIGNGEDTNTVTLLKGDGAGDFTPFPSSPLAMGASLGAWDIKATDVDNDDDEDLVVVDASTTMGQGDVGIFLNNGSAVFAAPLIENLGPTLTQPRIVEPADIDGDAYIDLVVGNFFPATFSVLINDGDTDMVPDGIGNGTFTPTAASPISVGGGATNVTGLAAAQLDNNGTTDVVVAKEFTDKIQVFTNNGSGLFAGLAEQTLAGAPGAIAVDNFNGGFNDLAIGNGNSVSIMNGVGDGTFTEVAGSPISMGVSGQATANALVAEELSGDSAEDLAVAVGFNTAESRIVILLGNGAAGFSQPPTSPELGTPTLGPNIPLGITSGQFNTGNLDLANSNLNPQPTTPVNIWLNDGPGAGTNPTTPVITPVTTPAKKKCKKGQKRVKGKCRKKKKKKKK